MGSPIGPNSVSGGIFTLSPRVGSRLGGLQSGPEESGQFTGDGDIGDGSRPTGGEGVEAFVESLLRFPCRCHDMRGDPFLSLYQRTASCWSLGVLPGGRDEGFTRIAIAGLGDRAEFSSGARGMFAGHDAHVGHQLGRGGEPANVAQFGGQRRHRMQKRNAAEGAVATYRLPEAITFSFACERPISGLDLRFQIINLVDPDAETV